MKSLTSKITHSLQYLQAVSKHLCVKDVLLDLVAIMYTSKGVDIRNAIDYVLSEGIPLNVWVILKV